jgi:hypothetical protein
MRLSRSKQHVGVAPVLPKIWHALNIVVLASSLAGCATSPSVLGSSPPAVQTYPPIALMAASTSPTIIATASVRGKSEGASAGAKSGAGGCLSLINPFLVIACLPFGLAIGAAHGEASTASLGSLQSAEAALSQTMGSIRVTEVLLEDTRRYAVEHGIAVVNTGGEAVSTIELGIAELRMETPGTEALPYRLVLTLRGRLLDRAGGKALDTFAHSEPTEQFTLAQWTEDGGRRVGEQLRLSARRGVEAFIDEWVLVYRGAPIGSAKADTDANRRSITAYVLEPVQPTVEESTDMRATMFTPFAPTLEPKAAMFRWQPLPRSFAETEVSLDRLVGLSYELRIRVATQIDSQHIGVYRAGPLLATYSGIPSPSFTVAAPLEPCKKYYWTVRATFFLDGQPRATEWAGMYSQVDPARIRRSEGSPSGFPFLTAGACP